MFLQRSTLSYVIRTLTGIVLLLLISFLFMAMAPLLAHAATGSELCTENKYRWTVYWLVENSYDVYDNKILLYTYYGYTDEEIINEGHTVEDVYYADRDFRQHPSYSGGFVGLGTTGTNLSNCLFDPDSAQTPNPGSSATFAFYACGTIRDCIYTEAHGLVQGQASTDYKFIFRNSEGRVFGEQIVHEGEKPQLPVSDGGKKIESWKCVECEDWNDTTNGIIKRNMIATFGTEFAFEGKGKESDPYLINNADDWYSLVLRTRNITTSSGVYFRMTSDIRTDKMIGAADRPFSGTFDGQMHTLDVTLNNNDNKVKEAPFVCVDGGTIKNIRVTGSVTGDMNYAAGLVGESRGAATISQVIVSVDVSGIDYIGGVCASNYGNLTITDSTYNGKLNVMSGGGSNPFRLYGYGAFGWEAFRLMTEKKNTKGVYFRLDSNMKIFSSVGDGNHYFEGTLDGYGKTLEVYFNNDNENSEAAPFGRINEATIKNLIVKGQVHAGRSAGLVLDTSGESRIDRCEIYADVKGKDHVGGYVSRAQNELVISDSTFEGIINGENYCGGFIAHGSGVTHIYGCYFMPSGTSICESGCTFICGPYFNMEYIFYTVPFGKVQGMQLVDYNGEEYKKAVKNAKNIKVTAFKAKAGKGRKVATSWKKNKKADGYQISWSTSKKFTKKTTKTRLISQNKATKATINSTIGKLKKGKTYYFRIRTYSHVTNNVLKKTATIYGKWSGMKKVTIRK